VSNVADPATSEKPKDEARAEGWGAWQRYFYERRWHWLRVAICIALGECLVFALEWNNGFQWLRNYTYHKYQRIGERKGESVFNSVVLIDDETYFKGQWTPRVPISRLLLAELVKKVAACNPAVIVVDIDLASDDDSTTKVKIPGEGERPAREITLYTRADWGSETVAFLDAVQSALNNRVEVVLTHEVGRDADKKHWMKFPNVYDGYGFGPRKPRLGHLFYDKDIRVLPLPVKLNDGSRVKSLSIEAAEAFRPNDFANQKWEHERLTRLIDRNRLVTVFAHELFHPDDDAHAEQTRQHLQHRIVWIGGAWHKDGYFRGTKTVDAHETPSGDLPGVFLHANYAETLLNDKPLAIGRTWIVEVILAVLIAFLLDRVKWPWKWVVMILGLLFPLFLVYVGVQNFGLYFDVFVIVFLLIVHILAETVFGWYMDHCELMRLKGLSPP
jgi:hypothetical protein